MKKSAIALTTLALLLGACTEQEANDAGAAVENAATEAGQAVEGAATEAGEAVEGAVDAVTGEGGSKTGKDTFVSMINSDVPQMDPGTTYDTTSGWFVKNMYEPLVAYKGTSLTELEGLLATDWEANADGTQYRFNLRDGVTFHTGNPFTCADAEYTFQRNLVTNTSDSGNWFIAESLLGTGANANDDDTITWERIDNAVQCDSNTLVFNLPKTDPAFVAKLAYYGQAIVDSKHAIEIGEWDGTEATWKDAVGKDLSDSALSAQPSGTGAYKMISKDASGATMEAYEDYWGGAPSIKKIVVQVVPEEASRVQAFLNGDADSANLGSREVAETQVKGQPGIIFEDDIPDLGARGYTMNQDLEGSTNIGSGTWGDGVPKNIFQDANMRKCIVYSYDYGLYIEQVLRGKGKQRNVLMPESFLGYDESIPVQEYDLAKAEEFCKVAHGGEAWDKGFTINAAYVEGNTPMQVGLEIMKQGLENMNPKFKVNLVGKQWSDIIDSSNKEVMVYVGWSPDYADPDNFIHTFYHSDGYYAPRGGLNDPEIDAWIDAARNTTDEAERAALYSQVAQKAKDEAYYLQIPASLGYLAVPENVQGISASTLNPLFDYYMKDVSKTR